MTDQSRKIQTIMEKRISLVQAIAAANCEHLRLSQIASGFLLLDQKDEEEGTEIGASASDRAENSDALDASMTRIETLESELADLDRELAAATERDER